MGTCIFVTEFLYFSMFEIVHKNGDTQEQINTSIDKRERRKGKQVVVVVVGRVREAAAALDHA